MLQIAPNDTLRWGYDRITLAPIGPIIEAASVNGTTNPRADGAVVGTPGTWPTNWQAPNIVSGITRTIVAVGVQENGQSYVDVRWFGTAAATATLNHYFDIVTTAYPALDGQTWTSSVDIQLVGGTLPAFQMWLVIQGLTSTNTQSCASTSTDITSLIRSDRLTRISRTFTLTPTSGTTVKVRHWTSIARSAPTGTVLDFTLRYSCPQIERRQRRHQPHATDARHDRRHPARR